MKKDRKDVNATTDEGRTIISKRGIETPRSAKAHYPLFKLARDLNLDEIQVLITIRKKRINEIMKTKQYEELSNVKSEIKMLTDWYRIRSRQISEEDGTKYLSTDFFLGSDGQFVFKTSGGEYTTQYFNEDEDTIITQDSDGNVIDTLYEIEDDSDPTDYSLYTPVVSSNRSNYDGWEYHTNVEL